MYRPSQSTLSTTTSILTKSLIKAADTAMGLKSLEYHAANKHGLAGKVGMIITKPMESQENLSFAYTPGVATVVEEINKDPEKAYLYTNKGHTVAVITNSTAVLGLGHVKAIAGKPVMEGKAALFKRLADVDCVDIEIDEEDQEKLTYIISKIANTYGGINLEDIKAPECFFVEEELVKILDIPVMHDDQHGTAIVAAAGLLNALELQNKTIDTIKLTCVGAGAAGIATMNLLVALGLPKENICLVDTLGVIHTERTDLNKYKQAFAIETTKRSLADAVNGADVFIGVSQADLLTPDMLRTMAENPIVFAMANPNPEIRPEMALAIRDDVIIATGRSDLPNQINNTLGFPFIFRAALDVRASVINIEMKIAAVHAIKDLAKQPVTQQVLDAYNLDGLEFGKNYLLPKPLDTRLLEQVPAAIARAAIASGVAKLGYPAHYPEIKESKPLYLAP